MDCEHRAVEVTSAIVGGLQRTITTRHLFTCQVCNLTAVVIVDDVVFR